MHNNKNVYFSTDNYKFVEKEAKKRKITFNRMVNVCVENEKKKKDEVKESWQLQHKIG